MTVVDSHTHVLPRRLAERIRSFFDRYLDGELAYTIDPAELLDSHAAAGIDTIWSLPYAHRADMSDALNESMAEVVATWSDRGVEIVQGCTVHVGDDDPAAVLVRAVDELGARVLKLHCSVGDYRADDARFDELWGEVSTRQVPVVVHAGHDVSGFTEADELAPIGAVASRFPDARIVIAHCGHRAWREALDLVAAHRHVHADLTPVVTEAVPLTAAHYELHADRLLFGTDAPNTSHTAAALLSSLRREADAPTARAILGGNAARLVPRR